MSLRYEVWDGLRGDRIASYDSESDANRFVLNATAFNALSRSRGIYHIVPHYPRGVNPAPVFLKDGSLAPPFCRDPEHCTGSCQRKFACND